MKLDDFLVTVSGTDYRWNYDRGPAGERKLAIQPRPRQPADPRQPFRIPLHPWYSGIQRDRIVGSQSGYSKASNMDASWPGILIHSPAITSLTLTNGNLPNHSVDFDGDKYMLGGRYLYSYDPTTATTMTEAKDFGAGKAAVDMAVFNNELIVAMGESEKIWKKTATGDPTTGWTQASDSVFAIALGVVESKLWRAYSTNSVDNCVSAPLTATSWVPAGVPYVVGDSTYAVHTILDYQGTIWCFKGDGGYAADNQYKFRNQTPQMQRAPHADNGKGAFTAHGSIWAPYSAGVLRVSWGKSIPYGPELTGRPDYRYWIRGGVEYGGYIYLLVNDQAGNANSMVIKMMRSPIDPDVYIFHDWLDIGGTNVGYFIGVTTITGGAETQPKLIFGYGNHARYVELGRGGGWDIDDSNYTFATDATLETGPMQLGPELSLVATLQGVDLVCDYSGASEGVNVQYSFDGQAFSNLLTTQEGGGTATISSTTNWESVTRYAPASTEGQYLSIKFVSSLVTQTSSPMIREGWAFGYLQSKMTDIIQLQIIADGKMMLRGGMGNGLSAQQSLTLFRDWMDTHTLITAVIDDYDESVTTRFYVIGADLIEESAELGYGNEPARAYKIQLQLLRMYFGPEYAAG